MTDINFSLVIDSRIFSLEVIQKAAYRCSDIAVFDFAILDSHSIKVTATPKSSITIELTELKAHFNNELLEQNLRHLIAEETKTERDLILAYAFSNTKLLG
jgi:His-Xaa-Ser system protein HxsD